MRSDRWKLCGSVSAGLGYLLGECWSCAGWGGGGMESTTQPAPGSMSLTCFWTDFYGLRPSLCSNQDEGKWRDDIQSLFPSPSLTSTFSPSSSGVSEWDLEAVAPSSCCSAAASSANTSVHLRDMTVQEPMSTYRLKPLEMLHPGPNHHRRDLQRSQWGLTPDRGPPSGGRRELSKHS